MEQLRAKYLKEDKETLVERILILEEVNEKLISLLNSMNEEIIFKVGILNEIIEEMDK